MMASTCRKRLNKRKWFSQGKKSVSTIGNEKYVSTRQKIAFTSRSIRKMKRINFPLTENQFPRAGIKTLLKNLLPPNFKNFKKALNKRILFLLNRKFASTSRKLELVTARNI